MIVTSRNYGFQYEDSASLGIDLENDNLDVVALRNQRFDVLQKSVNITLNSQNNMRCEMFLTTKIIIKGNSKATLTNSVVISDTWHMPLSLLSSNATKHP